MRLRRSAAGWTAAVALGLAAPAGAAGMPGMPGMDMGSAGAGQPPATVISVGFAAFGTPRVDVVAGEVVRWSNDSARIHDIVADDGSFDSGRVFGGDGWQRRFTTVGRLPYFCSLHPFMTGEVDVHDVLLDRPGQRAGAGKPYVLTGRVAAGAGSTVSIEGDSGAGFAPVTTAAVAADRTFRTTVVPSTTTAYRASVDGDTSPAVQLLVLDHHVTAVASRGLHGLTSVSVEVAPAAPGQTVVLQERLRDRFGWWPVARARLDARSRARFTVLRRTRVPARVVLTLADGATALADSPTLHVGVAASRRGQAPGLAVMKKMAISTSPHTA